MIILENATGRSAVATPKALKDLFATLKDNIRCVVLNACYSEAQAKGIAESIDCVVRMTRAIPDKSAIAFAASFYQALGYGRNIQTAFALGCGQIDLESLGDADVPKLTVATGVDAERLQFATNPANLPVNEPIAPQGFSLKQQIEETKQEIEDLGANLTAPSRQEGVAGRVPQTFNVFGRALNRRQFDDYCATRTGHGDR